MAFSPVVPVLCCNITPGKVVVYTRFDGVNRKKRATVPGLTPTAETHLQSSDMSIDDMFLMERMFKGELTEGDKKRFENLDKRNPGKMSIGSKKAIRDSINWLYILSKEKHVVSDGKRLKFRLSLITLTLASKQVHDDAFIKSKMLNRFLEDLRRYHGMKAYMWRAEAQKNGNIHFHITTNVYVHHRELRKYWNDIQAKYGYIDAFEAKNGHRDPNSTDVHSIHKVKNLGAYLCKYMSKDCEDRVIDGRQWFLSTSLSSIEPLHIDGFDGDIRREVESFVGSREWKNFDYAHVCYADIFTSPLSDYPCLKALRDEAVSKYSPNVN